MAFLILYPQKKNQKTSLVYQNKKYEIVINQSKKDDAEVVDFWRTNESELNLTGYMKSFQRDFDEREIEKMEELIVKTAEQISEAYKSFLAEI